MLPYFRYQLCSLICDRPPARLVRKVLFAYQLWLPKRLQRSVYLHSGLGQNANINNGGLHRSADGVNHHRIGWLNVRSLTSKTVAVPETIDDHRLDVFVLRETWQQFGRRHQPSPSCAFGLRCRRRCSPVRSCHGGIAVFYRRCFRTRTITLPPLSTFEFFVPTCPQPVSHLCYTPFIGLDPRVPPALSLMS
jgi:hypothetical protein